MAPRDDQYDCFAPLLAEYAEMSENDSRRERVREELVLGFLPVARHVARRFSGRGPSSEDLEQVASIGLLGALERFDPERECDFLSFAIPTMMGEVRRYFRDSTWVVRTPRSIKDRYVTVTTATSRLAQEIGRAPTVGELAADLDMSLDEVAEAVAAHGSLQPASLDAALNRGDDTALADILGECDADLDRAEVRAVVHDLVTRLPDRERTMLALRFVHEQTQREIASILGISQMHVSRLLTRTLAQLREHLKYQLDPVASGGPDRYAPSVNTSASSPYPRADSATGKMRKAG